MGLKMAQLVPEYLWGIRNIQLFFIYIPVASLLSCLNQLRQQNQRLGDHLTTLLQRRDHLLAVNARLSLPLASGTSPGSNLTSSPPGTGVVASTRSPRINNVIPHNENNTSHMVSHYKHHNCMF